MQDHDVSTSLELQLAAESEATQCGCVESLMIPDESSAFSGRLCQFRGSRRELGEVAEWYLPWRHSRLCSAVRCGQSLPVQRTPLVLGGSGPLRATYLLGRYLRYYGQAPSRAYAQSPPSLAEAQVASLLVAGGDPELRHLHNAFCRPFSTFHLALPLLQTHLQTDSHPPLRAPRRTQLTIACTNRRPRQPATITWRH